MAGAASGILLRAQAAGIKVTPLRDKLYLLSGGGGNIVVMEGPDGLLMVDSGLSDATSGILAETDKMGNGKVTQLFNTHWHADHTGSNVILGEKGATITAQENVKTRLGKEQYMEFFKRKVAPLDPAGLPTQTFKDKGKIKFGGDSIIHFHNANVFHGGDLLFNGVYPFIDYSSDGLLSGMASNAERIYKMVGDDTIVVPGHGPVGKKSDVKDFADMLSACQDIFEKQMKAGKTVEQVQADKPFSAYDAKWGTGFMKPEAWIAMNYAGMKKS
jgi:glyoxylase-like metal-dependent hydrolase (beta-lactamase superfamily II)